MIKGMLDKKILIPLAVLIIWLNGGSSVIGLIKSNPILLIFGGLVLILVMTK